MDMHSPCCWSLLRFPPSQSQQSFPMGVRCPTSNCPNAMSAVELMSAVIIIMSTNSRDFLSFSKLIGHRVWSSENMLLKVCRSSRDNNGRNKRSICYPSVLWIALYPVFIIRFLAQCMFDLCVGDQADRYDGDWAEPAGMIIISTVVVLCRCHGAATSYPASEVRF